jgi:predicted Zn finger-like uncharacterized protein
MTQQFADGPGPHWEKRGNTLWLSCPGCGVWFPVSPSMLRADAPQCRCPGCGQEFRPA